MEKCIPSLKPGKAIGLDDISTEQILNFGPAAKKWLMQLYNYCMALVEPEKDPLVPKNYRPISLLSNTYKLFERLLLNRIGLTVDDLLIPDEQAGFRPGGQQ